MRIKSFYGVAVSGLLVLFTLSFFLLEAFSQGMNEDKFSREHMNEYNIRYYEDLWLRYDKYTKENFLQLTEKLNVLRNSRFEREWEGNYSEGGTQELGFTVFRLDLDGGFVNLYVYTCSPELRYFSFGRVINNEDSIDLVIDFSSNPDESKTPKYIKVRWGERRYLVNEEALLHFSEKTVGIYVPENPENEPYPGKWASYWEGGAFDKPLQGYPQFPAKFKHLERRPISAKIVKVGKRSLEAERDDEGTIYNYWAKYPITINVGKNKNVKVGMSFYLAEIDETIEITSVYWSTAIGEISRDVKEDKSDQCWDNDRNEAPCRQIKTGASARTKVAEMF